MSGIMIPVVIHFVIMNIVNMMRLHLDAASLTTLAAVICLPVFISMMKEDAKKYPRLSADWKGIHLWDLLWIIGLALVCNLGLTWIMNGLREMLHLSDEAQDALFHSHFLIQLVGIGILVPVQEEVLFRGLVYQRLKDYNKKWLSSVLAAAFFALYHGNAVQIIFAFPMALILIAIYEEKGTLLVPILFHMTVNISSILITAGS